MTLETVSPDFRGSQQHFTVTNPIVVEKFQSGSEWWSGKLNMAKSELLFENRLYSVVL